MDMHAFDFDESFAWFSGKNECIVHVAALLLLLLVVSTLQERRPCFDCVATVRNYAIVHQRFIVVVVFVVVSCFDFWRCRGWKLLSVLGDLYNVLV